MTESNTPGKLPFVERQRRLFVPPPRDEWGTVKQGSIDVPVPFTPPEITLIDEGRDSLSILRRKKVSGGNGPIEEFLHGREVFPMRAGRRSHIPSLENRADAIGGITTRAIGAGNVLYNSRGRLEDSGTLQAFTVLDELPDRLVNLQLPLE